MGIASRVLLVFPRPSLNTAPLRFKSVAAPYSSSPTTTSRLSRMATEATPSSSSSSSVTAGHGINSPANGETVSSPASSAIDFLFLCHSLKVITPIYNFLSCCLATEKMWEKRRQSYALYGRS
jgi:hypothetical protein